MRIEGSEALKILRGLQYAKSNKKSRIHHDSLFGNANRIRALEGLCGQCIHLQLSKEHFDGRQRVDINCSKGLSPVSLYANTPLGTNASCLSFKGKSK